MSKTQIRQIVVVALLIIFAVVWRSTRHLPVPDPAVSPALTSPLKKEGLLKKEKVDISSPVFSLPVGEAQAARDPFDPPAPFKKVMQQREQERLRRLQKKEEVSKTPQPEVPRPSLELQGILWGVDTSQAIINRRVVSVGDTVEDAKVLAVTPQGVKLSYQGREFELLLPQEIRQSPRAGASDDSRQREDLL